MFWSITATFWAGGVAVALTAWVHVLLKAAESLPATAERAEARDRRLKQSARFARGLAFITFVPVAFQLVAGSVAGLVRGLAMTTTAGAIVFLVPQLRRIPFTSLWLPPLTWSKQAALAACGALMAGIVGAGGTLLSNPAVRLALVEKLFNK